MQMTPTLCILIKCLISHSHACATNQKGTNTLTGCILKNQLLHITNVLPIKNYRFYLCSKCSHRATEFYSKKFYRRFHLKKFRIHIFGHNFSHQNYRLSLQKIRLNYESLRYAGRVFRFYQQFLGIRKSPKFLLIY